MSLSQFLSILRARWLVALVIFVLVCGGAIGGSLLWPKSYTASASVVVDPKPDPLSALIYPGMASPAFMATQVDIIQSERVALRVVRNLRLADNPQVRSQWQEEAAGQGSIEMWLAEALQKSMDVKPSRESNVISVSYKAPDPRFAAGLANAIVQAYIDTALEIRVDPAKQYSTFFDTRSKAARDALESAQSKLSAFQREKGIIASDERLDIENARLNELSSQLVAIQALMSESNSRQEQARGASADRLQEVLNNPVIGSLKADLARSEARLQELSSRYGENHPQVIEAKANIAELRSKVEAETRRVTGGVSVSSSINRQREAQARAELEAQRNRVLKLKAVRDEGAVLLRDVEAAQRNYDALLGRKSQTEMESQANQSNVYPLTQAMPPMQPSSPKLVLNSLAGVFLGILLAIGTVLLLEVNDRRVRTVVDITSALRVPVLGVLPGPKSGRLLRRGSGPTMLEQRVVGQLPDPARGG